MAHNRASIQRKESIGPTRGFGQLKDTEDEKEMKSEFLFTK